MVWDMVYNVIVASGDSLNWVPCCSLLNHVLLQFFCHVLVPNTGMCKLPSFTKY